MDAVRAELDALFDGNPYGIVALDRAGRYARVNVAAGDLLGLAPGAMIGKRPADYVSVERRAAAEDALLRALRGETVTTSMRYRRADGVTIEVRERMIPISAGGEITGAYTVMRDATEEHGLALAVSAHADRLQALYRVATSTTTTTDKQIVAALRVGYEHFGLVEGFVATLDEERFEIPFRTDHTAPIDEELVGRVAALPGDDVLCVERHGRAYVLTPVEADGVRLGALGFIGTTAPTLSRADRELVRLIGALVASALVRGRARARLDAVVLHDRLTGLASSVLLDERLERAVRAHRRTGKPFALHLIDVDRFSIINERHGRTTGDALLRVVASRLRDAVREIDTAARLGGDAFAVLQIDVGNPGGEDTLAQRLADRIAEPVLLDGTIVRVSASIGIARCPLDGMDGRALLARADDACRRVKAQGRSAYATPSGVIHPTG